MKTQERTCQFCGCTNSRACVNDFGDVCRWVGTGINVCTACVKWTHPKTKAPSKKKEVGS